MATAWLLACAALGWSPDRTGPVTTASLSPAEQPVVITPLNPAEYNGSVAPRATPIVPLAVPAGADQWIIDRTPNPAPGDPPYVLRDSQGAVHRFLESTSKINLANWVGQPARIRHDSGQTLLASQIELAGPAPPTGGVQPAFFQPASGSDPIVLEELPPGNAAPLPHGSPVIVQPPLVAAPDAPPIAAPLACDDACGPGCGDICTPYGYSSNSGALAPDIWRLFDGHVIGSLLAPLSAPVHASRIQLGGWTQLGYHTEQTPLSVARGDLRAFNDVPSGIRWQQQWFWIGRQANACYGPDWGFRFDILYGTDAQKTQAFGNPGAAVPGGGSWDAAWDHGYYGWAIPQLYGELAADEWSVIFGHFFTPVGYEVVTAPDNFFYSHSLTMKNSEPFTHTGALATYTPLGAPADLEVYVGYTLGWDTGFDQSLGGSNFVGGFAGRPHQSITLAYIATAGNLGARSGGGSGYTHSIVADVAVTPRLTYVLQSDYVDYDDQTGTGVGDDQIGLNQYLLYAVNNCWGLGARVEWWKSDGQSFYEMTYGLNYRPLPNFVIRPEFRYDWTPGAYANGSGDETTLGVDAIVTY